jgi:hypothetical protein
LRDDRGLNHEMKLYPLEVYVKGGVVLLNGVAVLTFMALFNDGESRVHPGGIVAREIADQLTPAQLQRGASALDQARTASNVARRKSEHSIKAKRP